MEKINLFKTTSCKYVQSIDDCDEKCDIKIYPLNLRNQTNGNILSIHHTIEENDKIVRIILKVACFDLRGNLMMAIDKRGNIFILNFQMKYYWYHPNIIRKPTVIVPSHNNAQQFLIGTKTGSVFILHIDKSNLLSIKICDKPIKMISFPGQPLQPRSLCLVHAHNNAYLIDLCTLTCLHRLQFDNLIMTLKFAFYVPQSEQIITCFSNDTLHLWSGITLAVLRVIYPLKLRDRKLQLLRQQQQQQVDGKIASGIIQKMPKLYLGHDENNCPIIPLISPHDGYIFLYCYQIDGNLLCLTTTDNYLLILNVPTLELIHLFKLHDFYFQRCAILPKHYNGLLLGITNYQNIVLFDYYNVEYKLVIDTNIYCDIHISGDGQLLAIINDYGEISIWLIQNLVQMLRKQEISMALLRRDFKYSQLMVTPSSPSSSTTTTTDIIDQHCLQQELKKLLTRSRLESILQEYHCYPTKYRLVIWTILLQLPQNKRQFEDLLHMEVPYILKEKLNHLSIKNLHVRRNLIKCWSNLARWCKMLAYNDSIPCLILPFVKMFQTNPLVMFEVCATLICNQFQLFFEYHPMEPSNYLNICTNLLKYYDRPLYDFYTNQKITANIYAWLILRSSFTEILDQQQWLCLWDNIITSPIYYPIFCIIAYNIMQREIIRRLKDSNLIMNFFREQNPIDIKKFILKSNKLMAQCPDALHPKRYMVNFSPLPSGVYPKFLNYPLESLEKYERTHFNLREFNHKLHGRMEDLKMEEKHILRQLENSVRNEEHKKRLTEIDNTYEKTLKEEEERIDSQRKLLLLYRKEIRNRKSQMLNRLRESQKRLNVIDNETELNKLQKIVGRERLRDGAHLLWAKEDLHNQEMATSSQEYLSDSMQHNQHHKPHEQHEQQQTLCGKFHNDLDRLYMKCHELEKDLQKLTEFKADHNKSNLVSHIKSKYIDMIDCLLESYQKEFDNLKKNTNLKL